MPRFIIWIIKFGMTLRKQLRYLIKDGRRHNMYQSHCRVCAGTQLEKVFSLGNQPLANSFQDTPQAVEVYPLELLECKHCSLIQLSYVVPREVMYKNYLYIPSLSKTYLA